jgi:GT2 family glycosyltransferase
VSKNPVVSAVMVNWNGAEHLRIALPSLRQQTYSPLEILVVDNGSVDASAEVAAENRVTWLELGENRGLAAACNEGARRASGEFLVFLNNDMRFPPDFVRALVTILREASDVFAADALQLNWDGSKQVHLATRLRRLPFLSRLLGRGLIPGLDFAQEPAANITDVMQACAAAMAVRHSMFEQLGGFDARLPVGWEDTEICWRAWLRGWRTVLVPEATCWHRVGASGDNLRGAAARFTGTLGGRLLFATKHLPWPYVASTWAVSCLGFAKDLLTGRTKWLLERAKVIRVHGALIPALLQERSRTYREAGRPPRAHLRRMLSLGGGTPL